MQDFFKYDKIQGGAPLLMKSDNDGSKDENKRGLPLGIKTTAQGIKHFTSWDNISNSIEARNTTRFDDAQPNSLRFSMNNARAVYDMVDGTNIFPIAKPLSKRFITLSLVIDLPVVRQFDGPKSLSSTTI